MIRYINDVKCDLTDKSTRVYDSYKIKTNGKIKKLVRAIIEQRELEELKVTRPVESYVREIKAHNRLYKLGLFQDHTQHTDMEEPINRKLEKLYKILGR